MVIIILTHRNFISPGDGKVYGERPPASPTTLLTVAEKIECKDNPKAVARNNQFPPTPAD